MNVLSGQGIIVILVVGLIAGWLAAKIMRGVGFGLIGDIIVGIVGAFIGSWLFAYLGIGPIAGSFWINAIVTSLVGAVILLFVIGLIRR
jgi:uncharacterized membrane protein YeaQ/YmgE (transglycosylase-associated protein family)